MHSESSLPSMERSQAAVLDENSNCTIEATLQNTHVQRSTLPHRASTLPLLRSYCRLFPGCPGCTHSRPAHSVTSPVHSVLSVWSTSPRDHRRCTCGMARTKPTSRAPQQYPRGVVPWWLQPRQRLNPLAIAARREAERRSAARRRQAAPPRSTLTARRERELCRSYCRRRADRWSRR